MILDQLSASELRNLEEYVHIDQPFGPTDASKIRTTHSSSLAVLFDQQNKMYQVLTKNPSIIMGRRGSGKTAYLNSSYLDGRHHILISLKSHDAFAQVIQQIEPRLPTGVFAEAVSDLWETLLFCALFSHLSQTSARQNLPCTSDYLAKVGVSEQASPDSALWSVVNTLSKRSKEGYVGAIADIVRQTTGASFYDAKKEVEEYMRKNGQKAVILLDSLERFNLEIDAVAHTLKGLLKCVGQFNGRRNVLDVRFCLPTELYHRFMEISVSPLKDFSNKVTLQWHASELLSIAAHRILVFLRLMHPGLYEKAAQYNVDRPAGARSIFELVFPPNIQNGMAFEEDTVSYLLRHTQLLPRHFLKFMNEIIQVSMQNKGDDASSDGVPDLHVHQKDVVNGVSKVEHEICEEVFSAFLPVHRSARRICERCIPELRPVFPTGDLHTVFNTHGKKAMGSDDFHDFKILLLETGIVGRVISKTERYVQGLFEYTVPHRLVTNTEDELCIHPVFQKVFHGKPWELNSERRAIYPYGTDLQTPDLRDQD